MFQDIPSKNFFFKIFLTDKKISLPIHVVYWRWNFSISQENFEKIFFAWNVLKHKVKPKNSRNSTFFKKLKFPRYFWKTLVKFSSPKLFPWKPADFRLMAESWQKAVWKRTADKPAFCKRYSKGTFSVNHFKTNGSIERTFLKHIEKGSKMR